MHRHASLNRIYRLVWSHVHQAWIAVSETARGRGKRANRKMLLAAAALASSHLAQAGPTGGQVTAGQGAIQQSGNTTTVTQSSQKLSLSWKSFDTGAADTVNFVQPSASAIAVNRILATDGTQFFGKLNANGQVYLINPNGVLFGAGAQVNVGGLVASTLDIDDKAADGAARRFSGDGSGSVVNRGEIRAADGGYVAFVGNKVSNQGRIAAPSGTVALGAGSEVTLSFAGNRLLGLQVGRTTLDNLAENGGLIRADGGAVVLSAGAKDAVLASVVNNTGIIEARSVREVNGSIVLDGGERSAVSNTGMLDASGRGAGAAGGSVAVLGQDVSLGAGSRIDASGETGGGTVLVGGNFLGAGPERNARSTSVAAGSSIDADAVASGNGGRVAVWSDGSTHMDGRISARGGAAGGDGGTVETSGHVLKVGTEASVATLAPRGKAGDWLLDPLTITIGGFDPGDGDITGEQVTAALQNSNVTIKTGNTLTCLNIACNAGLNGNDGDIILANGSLIGGPDWTSGTTLTLSAYRHVDFRGTASLDATSSTGNIVLRADNTGLGTGTVKLTSESGIYGNGIGTLKIYYNPSSYASPTHYASMLDVNGDPLIRDSNLSAYMLINFGASIADKTYDGSTAANYSGLTVLGGLPANVSLDTSAASAAFASKNAGANKTVVISGVTLSGIDAGKYALNGLDSKTATINKASLTLSGISANGKTYDGTSAATMSGSASVSPIAGDVVGVAGSGAGSSFANKNAGTGKAVTVTGYTLTGTAAVNYNLLMPTGLTADIGKASLAVHGIGAAGKTYDGTRAATLTGSAAVTAFGSDAVSVSGSGVGSFADKDAGAAKTVTVSGYTLSGADAGNYDIVQPGGLTATIARASLAVSGVTALDKTYDAGNAATLSGSASVTPIGADDVGVTGSATATFASKHAGTGKQVSVTGYTLSGLDAGNYDIVQPTGLSAAIHKADLTLAGVTANGKTYDGTTGATLSGSAFVTAFGTDAVSVTGSGAGSRFADKNAGAAKAVTVSGYALGGADAANYNLLMPSGLVATIGKAGLQVTGVGAAGKIYDGGTGATLTGSATVTALGGDAVSVTGSGIGSFADKNAGSNKAVSVSGYLLAGPDADNYQIVQPAGLAATIGKADLALGGLSVADKTYDGSTAAVLSGSASVNPLGADAVTVAGSGSAAFADRNAGAGKAVTVTGYTLGGADAGNYTLVQPSGLVATIDKAPLLLRGLSVLDKTYDGTRFATLAGSAFVTAIGADAVSVTGSGVAGFADKNAGSAKAVSVTGYGLGGPDAGNYMLVAPSGLTASIGKAGLAVSGVTASGKTYDGSAAATLGGTAAVSAFGGDDVYVTGSGTGSFADKNAGTGKAVAVGGFALGGLDAGNYDIVQPSGLVADIGKASLAVAGLSVADKVYDGGTAATLGGSAFVSAIGGDAVSVGGTGTAVFADKNAGAAKAVSVSGYTLAGADAGNYTLTQPTGLTGTIARADLALQGLGAEGKVYDGTSAATLRGAAFVSAIGNDAVSVTGSGIGSFADKNAGSAKAVTVSGYGLAGADTGNYNLVMPGGLGADIAKASLAVTGISALDKTYDGGTAAMLTGSAAITAIGSDDVHVTGAGSASFLDKNAGLGKAVTVSGYALAGADAGNYAIVQPAGLRADIGKASLAVSGLSALDKVYDGGTGATLGGSAHVTAIGGDAVGVTGSGSAAFADKNAGTGKAVTVTGFTLGGTDAGNYLLVQPGGLTATIGKAGLDLQGLGATGKTYDGTAAATLTGTAFVSAIGNDLVNLVGRGSASFADRNAGSGKAVHVSGYALAGPDAGNYQLLMPAGLSADIARAGLAVSGIAAADKTYDGGTAATLTGSAFVTAIGNDEVRVAGSGTGVFADRHAGSGKAVAVSGFALAGADAGNYEVLQPAGLHADIGKAALAVSGVSALDKVYDGSTAAGLAGNAFVSAIAGDSVHLTGTGTAVFADRNAGAGKAVGVSGYQLAGVDAGNYVLLQPAGLRATIERAGLALNGIGVKDKTYDGTASALLTGSAFVSALAGDEVRVTGAGSASFADKNAGTGKAVAVGGYGLAGADAGNYRLLMPSRLSADIAPASLAVTGVTASGKTYDGGTAATLSGRPTVAAIAGDAVSVAGAGSARFADKNAGTGKAVTVSGYTLAGADAANYVLVQPTGLTADIGRASLAVSGLSAAAKVYDGSTAATLRGSASVAALAGDQVGVTGTGVASFADKNAGTGKAVTVRGYQLAGADATNYAIVQPAGLSGDITPARLVVGGIGAADKRYDGGTSATVSTAGATLDGKIAGDELTLASSGSFADAMTGSAKTVTLRNTIGGRDAGNYTVVDQATTLASITGLPPATEAQVRNTVVQVQSAVLPPQASAQPHALSLSSTIEVKGGDKPRRDSGGAINTRVGGGTAAPTLQIQNGGVHLPALAITTAE